MTATLKNTSQGYVLIVDESPIHGEFYYCSLDNSIYRCDYNPYLDSFYNYKNKIIAAENLEGVKGIRFKVNKNIIFHNDGNYERLVKKLIDTEVEATEHEEYWVVSL